MSRKELRWEIRIAHIREQIEKIIRYSANMRQEDFFKNDLTTDALTHCIQVIGEATYHVPREIKDKYDFIPWQDMEDMRHIIVHEYYRVDPNILYKTVTEDIPELEALILRIPIPSEER